MKFTCIGFDVREWTWSGNFNVDETGWEQNEEGYSDLIEKFNLKENEYQLIEIRDQKQLLEISEYIDKKKDCNLVAIEFPFDIVKLQDNRYGFNTASIKIDLSGFICRGFDVCDFNGLFSIFHNPQLEIDINGLIPETLLIKALEVVQIANVLDPNHSPFVIAKVYSLK